MTLPSEQNTDTQTDRVIYLFIYFCTSKLTWLGCGLYAETQLASIHGVVVIATVCATEILLCTANQGKEALLHSDIHSIWLFIAAVTLAPCFNECFEVSV